MVQNIIIGIFAQPGSHINGAYGGVIIALTWGTWILRKGEQDSGKWLYCRS